MFCVSFEFNGVNKAIILFAFYLLLTHHFYWIAATQWQFGGLLLRRTCSIWLIFRLVEHCILRRSRAQRVQYQFSML